jgi:serine/threonine protein kinase
MNYFTTAIPGKKMTSLQDRTDNYEDVLRLFELTYCPVGIYFQVGEIPWVQGWILHVSIVMSQINDLLEKILPLLIDENAAFKIVKDKDTARELLDGHLGYTQLAKIVSIYPENGKVANDLAKKLISLTKSFKGPEIPTDICLGSCVYTRYGSGNPVVVLDPSGKPQKFIYDDKAQLIPDPYNIPFVLQEGISWPFEGIAASKPSVQKKTLKKIYRPIAVFKADPRGNVWKAVYLKGLFRTGTCVIKEGKKDMCSDEQGRDVIDRLRWQQELHKRLESVVPLPRILDFFEEEGNAYLVMGFIKGISLEECIRLITGNGKAWLDLTQAQRLALVGYILLIIQMVGTLHAKGYVHRDIQAANFLVDPEGRMYMIDVELAYSLKEARPLPPFGLGTPGCMSLEQMAGRVPTIMEDIYGLSATILNILVGIVPARFNQIENATILENDIYHFIGNRKIAAVIAAGLNANPQLRPDLGVIRTAVEEFRDRLQVDTAHEKQEELGRSEIMQIIEESIYALVQPPMLLHEGLWLSKTVEYDPNISTMQKGYSLNNGFECGIAGILYFLGKAKMANWDIEVCMDSFRKGWDYLLANFLAGAEEMPAGLYGGAAGVALALATGIKAGLLRDDAISRQMLLGCLDLNVKSLDLADGLAGQGVALMQCSSILTEESTRQRLDRCVQALLQRQQKDGSWVISVKEGRSVGTKSPSFGYGGAGISWFLLQYQSQYPNPAVHKAIEKSMNWLDRATAHRRKTVNPTSDEGGAGLVLTYMKAYEVLQSTRYKKAAEDSLSANPEHIVCNDFSQAGGLAEIGELYLEAGKVFRNHVWQRRAEWIAQLFLHTCVKVPEGGCYWAMTQNTYPTADFMRGNSGIIHFLIRFVSSDQLGYRLLM